MIGPDEFMSAAFAGLDPAKELPAVSCARLNQKGELAFPATPYEPGRVRCGQPWHFNITTFLPPEKEARFAARLPLAVSTRAIVLDDIGDHPKSKITWDTFDNRSPPLPHYVLVTREEGGKRNCQVGYFIHPTHPNEAKVLIKALINAGLTDRGMRGANRWARLPGSTKHEGTFAAQIIEWDPPRS
jgi:hypothetical protein